MALLSAVTLSQESALAQTMGMAPLTGSAVRAIQTSLTTAIYSAKKDQGLVKAAITQALLEAIGRYGDSSAASIASVVIVTSEGAGANMDEIGTALAMAAVKLAPDSCRGTGGNPVLDCRIAATAIAQTIASEARAGEVIVFQKTAIAQEYPKLARIAGYASATTGGIAPAPGFNSSIGGGFIPGGGAGGGCLNPSCTQL